MGTRGDRPLLRSHSRSLSHAAPPAASWPPGKPAPWPLSSGSGPRTLAWGPGCGELCTQAWGFRGPGRPSQAALPHLFLMMR